MIKIAHCTDFSENAKKALEVMLFNFWSFDVTIDLIHLVETDYEESCKKLEALKMELINEHGERLKFSTYIFKEHERMALFAQLNSGDYMGTIVGVEGQSKTAGIGSFLSGLYEYYLGGMTLVPFHHKVKIENKILVGIEYLHLEKLFVLAKFKDFFNFQFSKLTILIRSEENLLSTQLEEIKVFLNKILTSVTMNFEIHNPEGCENFIQNEIKSKELDFYILFKDDYFDAYTYNLLKNKPANNVFRERLVRLNPPQEVLDMIKSKGQSDGDLNLRED